MYRYCRLQKRCNVHCKETVLTDGVTPGKGRRKGRAIARCARSRAMPRADAAGSCDRLTQPTHAHPAQLPATRDLRRSAALLQRVPGCADDLTADRTKHRASTRHHARRACSAGTVSSIGTTPHGAPLRLGTQGRVLTLFDIVQLRIPSFPSRANEHRDVFHATPHACDCVAREPPRDVASGACAMCAAQIISIL